MNKPNTFIIGAPKCGTTAMAKYLSEHNQVFVSNPKEPHHFNVDLNEGLYKDKAKYLKLFDRADSHHSRICEASVWYLYSKEAVQEVLNFNPDSKFIVMLRNPVEMVYSLHEQMVFSGYETELDFFQAWNMQTLRKNGVKIPSFCKEPKLLMYKDACSLGSQYERILKAIPKGRLLTILFDDFKDDPTIVWKNVENFLNISHNKRINFPKINAAKERKSLGVKRINDLYYRYRTALNIPGLGTGIFSFLEKWNKRERERKALPNEIKNKLIIEFSSEIEKLETLLNRDLSAWKE